MLAPTHERSYVFSVFRTLSFQRPCARPDHLAKHPAAARQATIALALLLSGLLGGLSGCRKKERVENGRLVAPTLQSVSLQRILIEQKCKGGSCGSRFELATRQSEWYVGRKFPADQQKIATLVHTWRHLTSDKVLVGTDTKRQKKLGLLSPCLKITWWADDGRRFQFSVSCPHDDGTIAVRKANGPVHLVRGPLPRLGAHPASWFFSRKVLWSKPAELTKIRILRPGSKPLVLVHRGTWKLEVSNWTMPADQAVLDSFLQLLEALRWEHITVSKGAGQNKTNQPSPQGLRIEIFTQRQTGQPQSRPSQGRDSQPVEAPSEVLVIGRCPNGNVSAHRLGPYAASGCTKTSGLDAPSSLDLLDKHLSVAPAADVTYLEAKSTGLVLKRSRGSWVLSRKGATLPSDPEAVVAYLDRLHRAKASSVSAARESAAGPSKDCLVIRASASNHTVCITGRQADTISVRRDDHPLVFQFPASITRLFRPDPMVFGSRVLAVLPMKLLYGFSLSRGRYREKIVSDSSGGWLLREPMAGPADTVALAGLRRALGRLVVARYKKLQSTTPLLTIDLLVPPIPEHPCEGLMAFFQTFLKTALPALADYHLQIGRSGKSCWGKLWGLSFELDQETCRALTKSMVPRRIFPGLRPDFALGFRICNNGSCHRFRMTDGRCEAAGKSGAVDQEACRARLADVVGLTAEKVLGHEPAPKTASKRICLSLRTSATSGNLGKGQGFAHTCLLFGKKRNGLRPVWVQGRSVVYGVDEALAKRLLAPIPTR